MGVTGATTSLQNADTTLSGGSTDQLNTAIQNDPELQGYIKQLANGDTTGVTGVFDGSTPAMKIQKRLQQLGIQIPQGSWLSEGEIQKNPNTFLTKVLPLMVGAATVGLAAPAIAGALGGSAAAGAAAPEIGITSTAIPTAGMVAPGVTGALAGGGSAAGLAGTAGTILKGAQALQPVLGGMADAGAKANQLRDSQIPAMSNAALARDKFNLEQPSTLMSQSVKASLLKNAAPVSAQWAGPGSGLRGQTVNFTGGVSDALKALPGDTSGMAQTILDRNKTAAAAPPTADPYLSQYGKESAKDKIVGGVSLGSSILSGLKNVFKL